MTPPDLSTANGRDPSGSRPAPAGARDAVAFALRGMKKSFGPTHALRGVDLEVRAGTIHALVGGNGSGKSTLIKTMAGVEVADAGTIEVGGRAFDAREQTPARAGELGLQFVHQQSSVFPELTVAENLSLGRGFETGRAGRIKWRHVRRRAEAVLERFEIDVDPEVELASVGPATQVMVAIARGLQDQEDATSGVLVLDEPTASLPTHEVQLLLDALRRYAAAGQAILYVSHRLEEVVAVADCATVLRDGRVVAEVPRDELAQTRLTELIVGRPLAAAAAKMTSAPGGVVLTASGLARGNIDLELRAGEVVGIAGLLGSGRSQLLRQLFGLEPAHGEIRVDGHLVDLAEPGDAMRAGLAYVPDDRTARAVFADLSVTDNIAITVLASHVRGGRLRSRSEAGQARDLMRRFGVRAASERAPISTLSGGNQQKVILARWLQREPRVLLLDEPTQGVDIGARMEIHRLVRDTVAEGATALVVSSDFDELALLCDRVLALRNGAIVAELAGADVHEEAINDQVYAPE